MTSRLSLRSRAAIMSASPDRQVERFPSAHQFVASDTDISLLIFFRRSPIYLIPAVKRIGARKRCGPQSAYSVMICWRAKFASCHERRRCVHTGC